MTQEPQPLRPPTERPVYKLSVDLLSTYKHINQIFYEAKRKKQALEKGDKKAIYNDGYDDDSGNYVVQIGEEIAGRYIVQEVLGKGSFGVVVKAHDHRRDECVAVKIIKNKVQFFHQAKVEIEILTKLNTISSEEHNIVKLKKVFSWKDHLCLVFELLSFNLYDLLKYTKFNGVSLNLIRKFASQILKTLDFLSSQNVKVIHCDLKPENILLKNPKRSGVKVIDFGSSCFLHKKMFKYIQSRFYRSPEVIWGLNYDCAIDMWSLACILVEMHTGLPLFDGKDEAEQLLKFQNVLGPSPNTLVELSPKRTKFYTLNPTNKTWVINQVAKSQQPLKPTSLEEIIGVHTGGPHGRRRGQAGHSDQDYACFLDLIKKMLQYNPKQRITPSAALQHPFLSLPDDPSLTIPPQIPTQTQSQPQQQQQQQSGFGHYPVQSTVDSSQQGMAGVSPRQYPQNQLPAGVSGLSPVITQLVGSHPVLGENNALTSIATQPMGTAASPPLAIQQAFQQAQLGGAQLAQLQLQAQLPFVHQAQQQYLASLLAQAQAAHCLIPSQAPLQQAQTQPQTQPQTHHNIVTSGPNAGKESDKKTGSTPTKLHSNYAVGCPEPVVLS